MKNRRTTLGSAELPAFVLDSLAAAGPGARPRVEIVFDPYTRLVVGYRVSVGTAAAA